MIEQATGRPLEADYQERILRPLGLAHTAYDPQGDITGPHARGYLVNPTGRWSTRPPSTGGSAPRAASCRTPLGS